MTQDDAAPYLEANRAWWDHVVPIHEASRGYDREGFLRGEKPLCPVELEELGPHVEGRSLLHLQCHFGMDTLNWARLGARVTGLDFAPQAIEAARRHGIDAARVLGSPISSDAGARTLQYNGTFASNGNACQIHEVGLFATNNATQHMIARSVLGSDSINRGASDESRISYQLIA